jgi:hypothetical protein
MYKSRNPGAKSTGAKPTVVSFNASDVKISNASVVKNYNGTSSLVRFGHIYIFSATKKTR